MDTIYHIETTASSKVIRQLFQQLLKSKSIIEGYKIPYAKSYTLTDQGRTQTRNVQLLVLVAGSRRSQSGTQLLDTTLKERKIIAR